MEQVSKLILPKLFGSHHAIKIISAQFNLIKFNFETIFVYVGFPKAPNSSRIAAVSYHSLHMSFVGVRKK